MAFEIKNGSVLSDSLEVHAVDHCNLSCLSCSHLSPLSPKRRPALASIERSLARLARVYRAKTAKVLGGEPLLRGDLLALIRAIRKTRVAQSVRILSNGTLLSRFDGEILDSVDSVELSVYPEHPIALPVMRLFHERCRQRGVRLYLRAYTHFRASGSRPGTRVLALVQRLYKACWYAHAWGCHRVDAGRFYKCPLAASTDRLVRPPRAPSSGILISDDPSFFKTLADYLAAADQALPACSHCLGVAGLKFRHRQATRAEWKAFHARPTESLVDYEFLERIEAGKVDDRPDWCGPYGPEGEFEMGNGTDSV